MTVYAEQEGLTLKTSCGAISIRKTIKVQRPISIEEHEAIAPQLLEMQQGLDKLVYALFLSYPLDAPANRAVRKMGGACRELRQALQTEAELLDAQTRLYLPAEEEHEEEKL